MLVVETITKIRRAYFAQKMTIKAIWRALHLARKVGRKVIRSQTTVFHCEREVQPQPKSSPWCDRLDPFLVENDGKPAGERLTPILVDEALGALGYACGYAAVRFYARSWCKERAAHRRPPMCRCRSRREERAASCDRARTSDTVANREDLPMSPRR
jgi:hypothetical protein